MNSEGATQEQIERINKGEMARDFLESPQWKELVKPIIDSMLIGLRDATQIELTSEQKAIVELKTRKLASEYLEKIEILLDGYVTDASVVAQVLEKKRGDKSLYKRVI